MAVRTYPGISGGSLPSQNQPTAAGRFPIVMHQSRISETQLTPAWIAFSITHARAHHR